MKKLLLIALLLLPSSAWAQCNGVFPNNTLCGNVSGAGNLPRPVANNVLTGVPGGTTGQTQYNNAGNFGGYTPSGDIAVVPSTGVETIQPGVITNGKMAANSVGTSNIIAANVTNAKLTAGAIGTAKGSTDGTSVTDTLVSTLLNAACTITPSICATFTGYYNVIWYGAVCNGSTDDTAAINAAITATPTNGKLIFPSGVVCLIKGSGTAILTRITPITIDCQGSQLLNDASVPSTTSMIMFAPAANTTTRRWWLTNCFLNANGFGNHVIFINPQSSNATNLAEFWIDHITDNVTANASGYSIFVGNIVTNTNGGLFNTLFTQNVLSNGINLTFAGDSIRITNNILTGSKYGVYSNLIAGAAGLIVSGNNITAANPLLVDAAVGNIVIENNEFEQIPTNTDPSNAVVDFRGGTSTLTHITFIGNSINALIGTGSPNPLKITNAASAYVESNTFVTAASVPCIVNSGGATIIGASNTFAGCSASVSNTGTLHYVQVGLTP